MEEYLFFPGCTLKTRAGELEESLKKSFLALGIKLKELDEWNCCGVSFSLVDDNLMRLVGPSRVLINAKKEGKELVTVCSMCYNVLKRVNKVLRENPEKRRVICDFIEDEYSGEVEVLHPIEILRDKIGFERIRELASSLGKKVGTYYGCLLLRPHEDMNFDEPENPTVMEELTEAIGCKLIISHTRIECCGSYLALKSEEMAISRSKRILDGFRGADIVVTSCPLCVYNLRRAANGIEIMYFTQLLEEALRGDIR